ncbi:hypothetical protein QQ045_003471 [Rhodiola kirilowii]
MLKKTALQKRMWQLEIQDERIWSQKSRIKWLKKGDQNTKYFHIIITWRAKRNNIRSPLVGDQWLEEPRELIQAAYEYFKDIFKKADSCSWNLEDISFGRLDDNHREHLESSISEAEIMNILKDCDGNKAPSLDGFNVNFYKKIWGIVNEEVKGFIREFCENGRLSKGINKTFVALIPKIGSPQSLEDYRPINLVNSMYKILSKCLAKRLSSILPQLISPNQSAFIANRNILDGIMITNELIHSAKMEKRKTLMIKLDFRKAYDSISWEYLEMI